MKRTILFALILLLATAFLVGCGEGTSVNASGESGDGGTSAIEEMDGAESTSAGKKLRTVTIDAAGGKRVRVRVEIADDYFERADGLKYRRNLGKNRGMLFVYDEEDERSFYMKDTSIPLSIAFMDSEGRIVDIQQMEPFDDQPPSYVSAEPAQYALEVNQGFFEQRGVEVGDMAELPR